MSRPVLPSSVGAGVPPPATPRAAGRAPGAHERGVAWRWGHATALAAVLTCPLRTDAQTTDAAILGVVRDPTGRPLPGAAVTVRNAATGVRTLVTTTGDGRFAALQLPLGGPYAVTVRRVGYRPAERAGYRLDLGTRVTVNLTLEAAAVPLAPLVIEGVGAASRTQVVGANYRVSAAQLAAIPTPARNFTDLASLAPTSGVQNSLLGQRWTATDVRVDGLQSRNMLRAGEAGAGPFTVSMEAIREFEVSTTVYDAAQGRQGGGAIRAATKAGTNRWTGSAFAYRRGSDLGASTDYQGRGRGARRFVATQWGGSVGGPLLRDRIHLFAAFDRQDSREPLFVGALRTPGDEVAAGVARDSLTRLLSILRTQYGVNPTGAQLGTFRRAPVASTLFGRLDWALSPRHQLTLRHNHTDWNSPLSGGVDLPIALYEARSDVRSREGQTLLALRSTLGASVQNALSLGYSSSTRRLTPVSDLPRGFVRVQSTLADGTRGDTRVQFGGSRLAPDDSRERQWQLVDQASVQRGDVLLTVGTDNALTQLDTYIAEGQNGLFEFESLADLAARRPFRYSRTVPLTAGDPTTRQSVLDLGAYAQAEWHPAALGRRLTATVGLRWDGTAFLAAPAFNPLVLDSLGLRTDRRPADWTKLQPRAQLVWDARGDGRDVLRVGGGRFAAQLPYYAQHNQLQNDGLQLADVVLTGPQVPVPDYASYRRDAATIPGVPEGGAAPPSYLNTVSAGFRTPSTWKGSAAYQRRVARWLAVTATLLASRTTGNYQYVDRNLRPAPAFTLDAEGGRGVFVPAATISAAGRTLNQNAWATRGVGRVLELQSTGTADQRAAVAEAALRLPRGGALDLSYTLNRARDNSTYGCCLARTATTYTAIRDDPRDRSGAWGPSDTDFRHKVVVAGSLPSVYGVRVSGRYVGSTGRPITAVVNGDINGDESTSNDLAFVFDPDAPTTPPDVAAAMRRVLANPDNVARRYLRENLGRVATRNGAFAPWAGRIDARVARAIPAARGRRVELTADVFNVANLLNRRWGSQALLPVGISGQNPVVQRLPLLNVVGFDQAARRYRYTVNENFGVLQRGGDPYLVQLGLRYAW
jgi:hypothetical protein